MDPARDATSESAVHRAWAVGRRLRLAEHRHGARRPAKGAGEERRGSWVLLRARQEEQARHFVPEKETTLRSGAICEKPTGSVNCACSSVRSSSVTPRATAHEPQT